MEISARQLGLAIETLKARIADDAMTIALLNAELKDLRDQNAQLLQQFLNVGETVDVPLGGADATEENNQEGNDEQSRSAAVSDRPE